MVTQMLQVELLSKECLCDFDDSYKADFAKSESSLFILWELCLYVYVYYKYACYENIVALTNNILYKC